MRSFLGFTIIAMFLLSCDDQRVYERNIDFDSRYWLTTEKPELEFEITDTLQAYNIYGSYLVIGADVNKENVDLTFNEIAKEIKILRSDLISGDELETTRNHFIGSLQSEITTPFAHADKIKTIALFALDSDYYQRMINTINSTTPALIAETSERYFQDDSFTRVAVG